MCDTFVATGKAVKGRSLFIFGKNSDREPNESQAILRIPRTKHQEKNIKIGNCQIPQVPETFEVILSKPFQMWGAEMGVNEFGLVIGNEAVFTKIPIPKKNTGLTGMELLRLALERTKTKEEALELITQLLEEYGQDALGGYKNKNFYYHNSFIIADPNGAIVLETVDRHWVWKKINNFYAISNGLTIGNDFDGSSKGLLEFAIKKGLWKKGKPFHFANCFSDWFYTTMSKCSIRRANAYKHSDLFLKTEGIGPKEAMDILRSHNQYKFEPSKGDMGSICLHANSIFTPNQTVGSMVVEVNENKKITVWLTGTSAPCLSLFKPFYFKNDALNESILNSPGEFFDPNTLWWKNELFHRQALKNYPYAKKLVEDVLIETEVVWRRKDKELQSKRTKSQDFKEFSISCLKTHEKFITQWTNDIKRKTKFTIKNPFYNIYWWKQNKDCKLTLS